MGDVFVNMLHAEVAAKRAESFAKSDQLSLGEIISKCEAIQAKGYRFHDGTEPAVLFDFEHLHPTGLGSWRGIYSELALSFSSEGDAPALSEFIAMLKEAIGKEYTGYKGGEFTMSRHTPVWVANNGNAGNTAVVDVLDKEWRVILVTGYRET